MNIRIIILSIASLIMFSGCYSTLISVRDYQGNPIENAIVCQSQPYWPFSGGWTKFYITDKNGIAEVESRGSGTCVGKTGYYPKDFVEPLCSKNVAVLLNENSKKIAHKIDKQYLTIILPRIYSIENEKEVYIFTRWLEYTNWLNGLDEIYESRIDEIAPGAKGLPQYQDSNKK